MRRKDRQPGDVDAPDGLVNAAWQIGDTAHRFFVLGELPGYYEYMENLVKELKIRGWPIGDSKADPVYDMVDCMKSMRGWKRDVRYNLDLYLNELSSTKTVRDFFVDPKNIETLQAAVDAAAPPTAKVWGDHTKVRENRRSLFKAAFSAAANKVVHQDTPENRLYAELKNLTATMKACYKAHEVPSIEFQGRVEEYLDKKGWLIAEPDDCHHDLAQRLWSLAAAVQPKTTIPFRWELQYDTFPPRDSFRHPQEFILQHAADIGAAAKEVAAELEAECKTEKGLVTRHCSIFGRENATDFAWDEARRKKEPRTPVDTQKSIAVKGPLHYKP